jgi:hypothetical protein
VPGTDWLERRTRTRYDRANVKLTPKAMVLLELDYGDLLRPRFTILTSRGWGQCTNSTDELLVVYGPKHAADTSVCDTSPYLLPPGDTTPDHWDCDGFWVPTDRAFRTWRGVMSGPLAVKFWDYRRFEVRHPEPSTYVASWHNGAFQPSQINWAIPNISYGQVIERAKRQRLRRSIED